ncbi:MAG: hypothetical protein WKF43_15655 [Acidimicrobiales bacterium]
MRPTPRPGPPPLLAAQDHHLVAHRNRVVVPAVDGDLVHGDGAGHGPATTADEHLGSRLGEVPAEAIGVPDGNGRHHAVDLQSVPLAVAQGLARLHDLDV